MLAGAEFSNGKTINGDNGIVINSIAQGSPADRLGLQKGDVIVGVGRARTESINQLRDILGKARGVIALQVQREDMLFYVLIR